MDLLNKFLLNSGFIERIFIEQVNDAATTGTVHVPFATTETGSIEPATVCYIDSLFQRWTKEWTYVDVDVQWSSIQWSSV